MCNYCDYSPHLDHDMCELLYGAGPMSSEYRAAYDKVCENLAVQEDGRQ